MCVAMMSQCKHDDVMNVMQMQCDHDDVMPTSCQCEVNHDHVVFMKHEHK